MKQILILFSSLLLLSGCAQTELASHWVKTWQKPQEVPVARSSSGSFKVGRPYRVGGIWYTPVESYTYDQTGVASWYGPNFHGKRTANGEIFDQNALTAAHPTLQIPSLVKVTNLGNGRSVVLRINDRGPFKRGRILDVSKRGSELLGFKGQGTARVRVQILPRESQAMADAAMQGKPIELQYAAAKQATSSRFGQQKRVVMASTERDYPTTNIEGSSDEGRFMPDPVVTKQPVQANNIYVQMGSFSNADNAYRYKSRVSYLGTANVFPAIINGKQYNRVRIGPLASVDQADAILNKAIDDGYNGAHLIID